MAAPLTGLGSRKPIPDLPHCACGCGRAASRGFPGDVHYAHACVPPRLRFPHEPGYAVPESDSGMPPPAAAVRGADRPLAGSTVDLLSGLDPT